MALYGWNTQMQQTFNPLALKEVCVLYVAENWKRVLKVNKTGLTEDSKSLVFTYIQKRCGLGDEETELFTCSGQKQLFLTVIIWFIRRSDFKECTSLTNYALENISKITGSTLHTVSLVDCFHITDTGIEFLTKNAPNLVKLDLTGFSHFLHFL